MRVANVLYFNEKNGFSRFPNSARVRVYKQIDRLPVSRLGEVMVLMCFYQMKRVCAHIYIYII